MNNTIAVVVTYNRIKLLLENINCLLAQSVKDLDILVIDNNSTDGTGEALQSYIDNKQILYHNTGKNLGGAGGFQLGIKLAAEAGYKYIWVMDDDCMPETDALAQLLIADEKLCGNYGFLASKVLWKDGSICAMNVQRRTLTKNVKDFSEELISVKMSSFVSFFVKSETVCELGLPIKEFFIWTDDWEYTRRISKKYPCYLVTGSVVVHKSNANIGANISNDSLDRLDRYRYLYRNDVYLYRREGIKGFFYELFRLNLHALKTLFKAKNKRFKRIKIIFGGSISGLKFNPKIEFPEKS